jgi:hypothetical protein
MYNYKVKSGIHSFLKNPSYRIRKALFTSRVFEGIGGDYLVFWNFSDRMFTRMGFEGIIPRYPHKSPPH